MYLWDVIAAAHTSPVFHRLAAGCPRFMGSVLAELFSRRQAVDTGKLGHEGNVALVQEAVVSLETLLKARKSCLRKLGQNWGEHLERSNERVANVICSIPSEEALRFGFAPWFVRLTKESILDSATSSTVVFLKMQSGDIACFEL